MRRMSYSSGALTISLISQQSIVGAGRRFEFNQRDA